MKHMLACVVDVLKKKKKASKKFFFATVYEKYRELSWDLHNSVTSDRVIVNNSRRYFIKASLYRRWSSPTNRTICKHCNICRRLQPRPSILPFPLLFLRFLHRIFIEISSISTHEPLFADLWHSPIREKSIILMMSKFFNFIIRSNFPYN